MVYEKYRYLFPPRPEQAISPLSLSLFESRGYVAQLKKNGTSNVMAISPKREIIAMMRDKTAHKAWSPDERTRQTFLNLPGRGWYYFAMELLNNKVPGIRHINYIFDILVADGTYLVGKTFLERQAILADLFPDAVDTLGGGHKVIDDHTWLATVSTGGFGRMFASLEQKMRPEDEGLVLKKPEAKLVFCSTATANAGWQVKCRLPTKNYSH